jgi:hypothetical protein
VCLITDEVVFQHGNPLGRVDVLQSVPLATTVTTAQVRLLLRHCRRVTLIPLFFDSFMGGDAFCIKVCDLAEKNAASLCLHIYDRIGCAYNPRPPTMHKRRHSNDARATTKTLQGVLRPSHDLYHVDSLYCEDTL